MADSKEKLADVLHGTPGWLGADEAWALHEAVRDHPSKETGLTVVEIGSWQGRSAVALASGLRARGGGTLYAIDPHSGTALHEATGVTDTYEACLENVRAAGLARYVKSIRAVSAVARSDFEDASVDVLFVDGSHKYRDVLTDIDSWTSALADVATVAFHDAFAYSDVRRALEERVVGVLPFHNPRMVEDTLLAEFRRGRRWTLRDRYALRRFEKLAYGPLLRSGR
jgi:hypothetical protein